MADDIVVAVGAMIVDGRLGEGERVNEVRLAAQLAVSRTPLREALHRLAAEGALVGEAHRGVFVAPLTAHEIEQLYPIRAILDPSALRLAGIPSRSRLAQLERLNVRIADATDPETALARDDQWHLLLIEACPNRILIELIEQFIRRTRRYELGLMRARGPLQRAVEEHGAILTALRHGQLESACAGLARNMNTGSGPILEWLRERAGVGGK